MNKCGEKHKVCFRKRTYSNKQFPQDDLAEAESDRASSNAEQKENELIAMRSWKAFPVKAQGTRMKVVSTSVTHIFLSRTNRVRF